MSNNPQKLPPFWENLGKKKVKKWRKIRPKNWNKMGYDKSAQKVYQN